MDNGKAIKILESSVVNPCVGLPEDLFHFISRHTPLVNVDLLVKDERGRTLLAWRKEENFVAGWHIPGGIVRYKERLEDRIIKVAEREIGVVVSYDPVPIAINQVVCSRATRGHFISLLFRCYLPCTFIPENKGLRETDPGFLRWHEGCPDDVIKVHEMYRKYMAAGPHAQWAFAINYQEHNSQC